MRDARVTAVILAGGAGQRVGGQDKGWLAWRGRALVEHALSRIVPQAGAVIVSANRNLARYRALGITVAADAAPPHEGPLAGIVRAFDGLATPWLVTLPVDVPVFPDDMVERLLRSATASSAQVAIAHDGERSQTLFAAYSSTLAAPCRIAFDAGERAVWRFQAACDATSVPFAAGEFEAPDLTTLALCPP
jgi:molybdenum cofactor guanylyltransferase